VFCHLRLGGFDLGDFLYHSWLVHLLGYLSVIGIFGYPAQTSCPDYLLLVLAWLNSSDLF